MTEKMDPLAEQTLSTDTVYKGSFLQVRRDEVVTPDGVRTTREYLHHPGAAMMIPLFDNGDVILERQYRHPMRQVFFEFPAGKLNPGESPLSCARRELIEETGFEASEWIKLGRFNNAIGYSDEEITVYLATGLKEVGARPDPGEVLEIVRMPWTEVVEKTLNGEFTDVKTIIGAYWLKNYLSQSR